MSAMNDFLITCEKAADQGCSIDDLLELWTVHSHDLAWLDTMSGRDFAEFLMFPYYLIELLFDQDEVTDDEC